MIPDIFEPVSISAVTRTVEFFVDRWTLWSVNDSHFVQLIDAPLDRLLEVIQFALLSSCRASGALWWMIPIISTVEVFLGRILMASS